MSVRAIGKQRYISAEGKELRQRPACLIHSSHRRNITKGFYWRAL